MKMIETWVIYAFIAFIGYFFTALLMKFVSSENPFLICLILYGAASVLMFLILAPKMEFSITTRTFVIAVFIGIFSVMATVFVIKSMNLAPNPGYSVAIFSSNFVLLTIVSVFVFGSSLSFIKVLGILVTIIGLILLSI